LIEVSITSVADAVSEHLICQCWKCDFEHRLDDSVCAVRYVDV